MNDESSLQLPEETQPGIRKLGARDLPRIKQVIDATGLFPPDMLDDMTAAYLGGGAPDEIWLTGGDAIVYCAPERMTDGAWNMLLIAVHPSRQRSGLGARLVAEIESRVKDRAGRILLVETSGLPEFEGTRRFYRRLGYQEEARIRDYYRAGDDKVVFRKKLR
jgi:ribosomal protein S18 acetylase RimI-like enzyme